MPKFNPQDSLLFEMLHFDSMLRSRSRSGRHWRVGLSRADFGDRLRHEYQVSFENVRGVGFFLTGHRQGSRRRTWPIQQALPFRLTPRHDIHVQSVRLSNAPQAACGLTAFDEDAQQWSWMHPATAGRLLRGRRRSYRQIGQREPAATTASNMTRGCCYVAARRSAYSMLSIITSLAILASCSLIACFFTAVSGALPYSQMRIQLPTW